MPICHPKSEIITKNKTVLPAYDEIINIFKEQHHRFPHFGFIALYFAVGSAARRIVVETNLFNFAVQPFNQA